jgi:transposase
MTVRGFDPESGEVFEIKRQPNDEKSLRETFSSLAGPVYGAMESGTNSWAVFRILEPYFERLIVVDPATVWGRTARRGAKTDKRDAMALAMKMYRGELIALYVPDERTQELRNLGRARINASRHVTKTVNEIGSLLRSWGIIVDCSLLSKEGQKLIEQAKPKLPELSLMILERWLEMLRKAQEVEAELEKMVVSEVARDEICKRLKSIPSIGPLTALVVRAEIGDISRFGSAEQLVCYCGLSPTVSQSADSIYYGKLNRFCNKFLKYILVLRAQSMGRSKLDNPMAQTYWRVLIRGKNHAKIAVARQLVRVIFSMLKNKTCWDSSKITSRRGTRAASVA